ncbi:DUF6998 domain-containing protein [Sphingobium abikonense]|uniref:DUF6998 domain-containing protein n=1 Tax=Sphingobium abikonense TaxID=86193 RepID=UPI0035175B2C
MMDKFSLPTAIADLLAARNELRSYYGEILRKQGSQVDLRFTLDGNLVGDIGEALAAELFGVRLVETKSTEGIDGHAPDGRTVQVKATGTKGGPAFRQTETRADHLLFFCLDFENGTGEVAYNGPEENVTRYLPETFSKQRCVSRPRIRGANEGVADTERLPRID